MFLSLRCTESGGGKFEKQINPAYNSSVVRSCSLLVDACDRLTSLLKPFPG